MHSHHRQPPTSAGRNKTKRQLRPPIFWLNRNTNIPTFALKKAHSQIVSLTSTRKGCQVQMFRSTSQSSPQSPLYAANFINESPVLNLLPIRGKLHLYIPNIQLITYQGETTLNHPQYPTQYLSGGNYANTSPVFNSSPIKGKLQ